MYSSVNCDLFLNSMQLVQSIQRSNNIIESLLSWDAAQDT